jgi:myosin heavy subunit
MSTIAYFEQKLVHVFNKRQAKVLAESILESQEELVKTEDFKELKSIVKELATAQQRTEQRLGELATAQLRTEQRVDKLAEAQKELVAAQQEIVTAQLRTEQRVEKLATAQLRTEQRVEKLAEAQKELVAAQQEIVTAQLRTEQRVEKLAEAQKELAAALQRTEQRVEKLAEAQKELATAQQRTEQRVEELATAQQRTEQRVEELATAQQRTEQRLEELATALQRTDTRLQQLVEEHNDTRKQVGGLAMTVGYTLENKAYKALPSLLKRDFGLIVQGRIKRTYLTDNRGNELEVNITGQALKEGKTVTLIGEGKSQLSKNHIDSFIRKRLNRFEGVFEEVFPVLITHMTSSSDVEAYAKTQDIAVYYSYDFEE